MSDNRQYIVLGIHFGHDAGAAIVKNGQIIADVSEERFNRIKHSADYPLKSIEYCLKTAGCSISEVDEIALVGLKQYDGFENVFGHKLKLPTPPRSRKTFRLTLYGLLLPLFRLLMPKDDNKETGVKTPIYCQQFFLDRLPKITLVEHHLAHAASAYYTTNDQRKMIIATIDGAGDNYSSCLWLGQNGKITPLIKYGIESSIGWFYSNITEAIGWWHGEGEGKTMGLAPYGDFTKCRGQLDGFYPKFKNGILTEPYHFPTFWQYKLMGAIHWHSDDARRLTELVKKYGKENIAAEAQRILEEQVMAFILPWLDKEKTDILTTAGGVFLNVKLNQRIWMTDLIGTHYPYANAGDSGLAVGAALYAASENGPLAEKIHTHLYWGPEYSNREIENILKLCGINYKQSNNVSGEAARYLADNEIVAWFQGRMEAGPRALGNRSILMSPKKAENKDIINAQVKFREAFRPFCPSLIDEAKGDYLVNPRREPYMITSFDCQPNRKAEIPAVVHVDGTLRPQTVTKEENPRYWHLIAEFGKLTGTPVVLNTSFNIRGEPIVCSPYEAIKCFFSSGIDILVIGDFIIEKSRAPQR